MNYKGFSLIECILYCGIASSISVLAISFFANHAARIYALSSRAQSCMQLYAAADLLTRDLQHANAEAGFWHIHSAGIIFTSHQRSLGWELEEDNLYRLQGAYDFAAHTWIKKHSALIATHISQFVLKPGLQNANLQRVTMHIASKHFAKEVEKTVSLIAGNS